MNMKVTFLDARTFNSLNGTAKPFHAGFGVGRNVVRAKRGTRSGHVYLELSPIADVAFDGTDYTIKDNRVIEQLQKLLPGEENGRFRAATRETIKKNGYTFSIMQFVSGKWNLVLENSNAIGGNRVFGSYEECMNFIDNYIWNGEQSGTVSTDKLV